MWHASSKVTAVLAVEIQPFVSCSAAKIKLFSGITSIQQIHSKLGKSSSLTRVFQHLVLLK